MNRLHQTFTQKYPKYNNWHQTKHHNKIHWGVLVVFTLLIFGMISRWAPISLAADIAAPTAPTGLTVQAVSSSQINLSWTASTDNVGVTGYKIYRCSGSACAPTVQIATSATNSYLNTGLTASTAYTYAVSAYDAAGNDSAQSAQANAITQNASVGGSLNVPLTVSETAGINRVEEPVTSGIPLSKSLNILTTNNLGIFDGNTELPAQFKVTARWGGSPTDATKPIKWLLVDFQATVSANTSKTYILKDTGSGNASGILANLASGTVTVNTGNLRFTIKQNGFNLFDEAWYDPTGDFGAGTQVITSNPNNGGSILSDGITYSTYSSVPTEFIIEENGPLRAVIKVKGRFQNGTDRSLGYVTHIYAYKGKSYTKIYHSYYNGNLINAFQNSQADLSDDVSYSNVWLNFNLNLTGQKNFIMGRENGLFTSGSLGTSQSVYLNVNDADTSTALTYTLNNGVQGALSTVTARADGWADLSDGSKGVAIADRWFWQKYEKRLTVSDSGNIRIDLSENDKLREAQGLSDEIMIYFHNAGMSAPQISPLVFGFAKNPLYAKVSSSQYLQSQAFYPLSAISPLTYPNCGSDLACLMDYNLETEFSKALEYRESDLIYGGLNFGGFLDRGRMATLPSSRDASAEHGVNYYDGIYVIAHNFARKADVETGNSKTLDWLQLLTESARHYMETEAYHVYPDNPGGRQNINGLAPAYSGYYRNVVHTEHIWGSGLFYYYYLTGDERAKERALEAAESLFTQDYVLSGGGSLTATGVKLGRLGAQSQDLLVHAYELTRDPTYLARLKTAMDAVAGNIAARSDFRDVAMRQVVGLQLPALYRAWDVTGRTYQSWADAIVKVANWTMKEDRNPTTGQIEGDGYYGEFLGTNGIQANASACVTTVWFINMATLSKTDGNHWACYPQTNLELMGGLWTAYLASNDSKYIDFFKPLYTSRLEALNSGLVNYAVGFGRMNQSLRNAIHLNYFMMTPFQDITPPAAPTGLTATPISSSQINLSWTASTDDTGIAGYKIYRCSGLSCAPTQLVNSQSVNSLIYNDTGLTASTAYTYAVSAYDAAGNESGKSSLVQATTLSQFKPSDLNQDQKVDQLDFDILKQDWNRTDKPVSDLNQDGIVDSRDLGIMMSEWTR